MDWCGYFSGGNLGASSIVKEISNLTERSVKRFWRDLWGIEILEQHFLSPANDQAFASNGRCGQLFYKHPNGKFV